MTAVTGGNLWELIEARVAATPDAEMLVDQDGRRMTFAEYKDAVEQMAAGLHDLGVGAGDVVAWELPTWIETVVLAAAINRLDAVQNPIIAIYREREVGFCCRQAGAKLLLTPAEFGGFDFGAMGQSIAEDLDGLTAITVAPGSFPSGDPSVLPPPPRPASGDHPVRWLCYTSGTTSDPKGARHTDASIDAIARAMAERLDVQSGDRPALVFPFPHIGGLTWLFTGLQTGCASLLDQAFVPASTTSFLAAEGCTHPGSGTPFHMVYLAAQRQNPDTPLFPDVKNFPGGGAPKPPQLHYEVKAELGGSGVVSGWGLTEAPILTMGAHDDPDDKLAQTEGRAMPGVDLKVVSVEGEVVGPGQEGELRAKAPQLMKGYLDATLDDEAFDDDGYFRTGDLGVIDDEGYVVITGRLKDVIIRHGENISAKEVEDLLFTHDRVQDVAVIGLPDPRTGERACAVVSTPEGAEPLTMTAMREFLTEAGLRTQAIPEQLEHVELVPRNPS
ncbi:MAG: AMP-binding protein, partial [Acidimicrobiia bacterium]|nr:AMP-binding protein [Acidimicrobiia bacterium]